MENASKALIMAGIILIGILLIALMVYFFNSAYGLRKSYDNNISTTRMVEFNTQFTKYNISMQQYEQSEGNAYVTIYDIVTLGNLAANFNEKNNFSNSDNEYIEIIINGIDYDVQGNSVEQMNKLLKNYNQDKFYAEELKYDEAIGRIKSMTFRKIKEDK